MFQDIETYHKYHDISEYHGHRSEPVKYGAGEIFKIISPFELDIGAQSQFTFRGEKFKKLYIMRR